MTNEEIKELTKETADELRANKKFYDYVLINDQAEKIIEETIRYVINLCQHDNSTLGPPTEPQSAKWQDLPKDIQEHYEKIEAEVGRLRLQVASGSLYRRLVERQYINRYPAPRTREVMVAIHGTLCAA